MNSMTEGPLNGPEPKSVIDTSPEMRSAGTRLRLAREAAGLTLDDVAQQLKLARRQVVALESDDVNALPGPTFVRGFIRNYARLLKIDAVPLIEASRPKATPTASGSNMATTGNSATLGSTSTPSSPAIAPTMSELPRAGSRESTGVARWLIPSLLVLLLAAGAGYYQFGGGAGALRKSEKSARNAASESAGRNMPSETDSAAAAAAAAGVGSTAAGPNVTGTAPAGATASPPASTPSSGASNAAMAGSASGALAPGASSMNATSGNAVNASAGNNPNATNKPNAANNVGAPTPTNASNVGANASAAAASGASTPSSASSTVTGSGNLAEGRLEFEFAGQAWVEVRDKHGDVLISRTMPPKTKHTLRGEPPFTVRVGNASAVSVVLDGRPVDLMPYTRNEIAKLVIPAPNP